MFKYIICLINGVPNDIVQGAGAPTKVCTALQCMSESIFADIIEVCMKKKKFRNMSKKSSNDYLYTSKIL